MIQNENNTNSTAVDRNPPQTNLADALPNNSTQKSSVVVNQQTQSVEQGEFVQTQPDIASENPLRDNLANPSLTILDKISLLTNLSWIKLVAFMLTIQGLYGMYKSIRFIFVDFPLLEQALNSHLIGQEQVNEFASKAIMMVFTTILSMFFGLKLSVLKTEAAKKVQTIMGICLFIFNTIIMRYLNNLGSSMILQGFFNKILQLVKSLPGN